MANEVTPREFTIRVRVYYEDTDFSGIVYHARYLHFFERGRTEALREVGVTHTDLLARDEKLVFAVRSMTIDWVSPARIDDILEVRTSFVEAKGARMRLAQTMHLVDEGAKKDAETLIARAQVEAACLSIDGRPRRLPTDVISRLR